MSEDARLKATVHISGLDIAINSAILAEAFLPFGEIAEVTLPKADLPSANGSHRGYGYVEFESEIDAREAIDNMDQSELFGHVIKVAPAKSQKDRSGGLGDAAAVWTKESYMSQYLVTEETQMANVSITDKMEISDHVDDLKQLDMAGPLVDSSLK